MTTTPAGWVQHSATSDDSEGLAWIRAHRLYRLAVAAILTATLVGAAWADQPRGQREVGSRSSSAVAELADTPTASRPPALDALSQEPAQ